MSKTDKQIIGNLGEGIICNYLKDKGFEIIERNYWKPWGEIDVIASKKGTTYFVEVKTVQTRNEPCLPAGRREIMQNKRGKTNIVTHETQNCVSCENFSFESLGDTKGFVRKIVSFFERCRNKSVSCGTGGCRNNVPHETLSCENSVSCGTKESVQHEKNLKKVRRIRDLNRYRPEDNLHPWKLKRLSRVIQTYLVEKDKKNVSYETDWQFDVAIVYLNIKDREVKVKYLEDIIL